MCIQYIIHYTLCTHRLTWCHVNCKLGAHPFPNGCPNGRVDEQIDSRPGARCPECLRQRAEVAVAAAALAGQRQSNGRLIGRRGREGLVNTGQSSTAATTTNLGTTEEAQADTEKIKEGEVKEKNGEDKA